MTIILTSLIDNMPATLTGDVREDYAGIIRRNMDLHLQDGFEQNRTRLFETVPERSRTSTPKASFVRVYSVELAVAEFDFNVDDAALRKDPDLANLANSLLYCGDEVPRDRPANDFINKYDSRAGNRRLDAQGDLGELPATARLLARRKCPSADFEIVSW